MNSLALQLLLHGAIVLLVGLLTGIPYGKAITGKKGENVVRAWRVAHSGLSMGGTTMIAISAVISSLDFAPNIDSFLVWSFVISGYGFCLALPYKAWVGHRGLSVQEPTSNNIVYFGNIVGAVGSLAGTLILIFSCLTTLYF